MTNIKQLQDIASVLRRDLIENLGSTSQNNLSNNLSYTEMLSCLFFSQMHIDIKNPDNPDNDEFILANHNSNKLLNIILKRIGAIKEESPENPWMKTSSNNPHLNLSISAGLALSSKIKNRKFRSYALLEEKEVSQGLFYEALEFSSLHSLNNLCVLLALNSGNSKLYKQRFDSFGWNSIIIQGNDIKQTLSALKESEKSNKPTIILANMNRKEQNIGNANGKDIILNDSQLLQLLKEIPSVKMPKILINKPKKISIKEEKNKTQHNTTEYKVTDLISTEEACKNALNKLISSNKNVNYLNSHTIISEENALGIAIGLSTREVIPFITSENGLISELISKNNRNALKIFGKAPSDISSYRSIKESYVFSPSDAISSEKIVKLAENLPGLTYIKNSHTPKPILYKQDEEFLPGNFKTLISSSLDKVVIAGSGNTVQEAMKAHTLLKGARIDSAVIDLYSIKPFNTQNLIDFVKTHGNLILVMEENYSEGNIGEMLSSVLINSGINLLHLPIKENTQLDANAILLSIRNFLESKPLESLVKEDKVDKKKSKIKSRKRR
ncbi:MAG: transketolase C-terminal domain-containing protein [Nanoarchaeota archaeon]|nr:transketolase C-terminal domain-containing protein [Nanoarchaeota archaeon]